MNVVVEEDNDDDDNNDSNDNKHLEDKVLGERGQLSPILSLNP